MSNIISIVYTHAGFFIGILLVIFVYLISWFFKMPFHIDPYGEKSVRLTNKLNAFSRLFSHILPFSTFGKCKILRSRDWRAEKIIEVADSGIDKILEANFIAGETGRGMRETIRLALEKGYKVTLLSGPHYCDAVDEIKGFIIKYPKFELFIDKNLRPEHHFGIIGKRHIFLEVPHHPYQEKKYSLGINNAKSELVDSYTERFDKMKESTQKIASIEEYEEIVNKYCLIPPQKGKPWWRFWS